MEIGYGTNGFSNHRLDDALGVIADLGYTAAALTLDHAHLDPYSGDLGSTVDRVGRRLRSLGLRCVVETGARFLLDPTRKHSPSLVSDDPGPRIDLLCRAVRIAADLEADCVSFWSGTRPEGVAAAVAWQRLCAGVEALVVEADRRQVPLALEPEPGMVVQHLTELEALREQLGRPERLGTTLDVGHCVAVEPVDAAACIRRAGPTLRNVQLDDMRRGVHEHLEFGEGELDLVATLGALREIGFDGVAAVELPRHSHAAPTVAMRAMSALRAALDAVGGDSSGHPTAADAWTSVAERAVREDPIRVRTLFPAAGREVGRGPLRPAADATGHVHGTVDDRARSRLVVALADALPPPQLAVELSTLYEHGDGAERRGVLRGLSALPRTTSAVLRDAGLVLVRDALRANDTRLVAAAMGRFTADWLDQHGWRHGVLKCVFVGVPLDAVEDLHRRSDAELQRMLRDFAAERRAAGRDVPADASEFLASLSNREA